VRIANLKPPRRQEATRFGRAAEPIAATGPPSLRVAHARMPAEIFGNFWQSLEGSGRFLESSGKFWNMSRLHEIYRDSKGLRASGSFLVTPKVG
jgi:hypothetical protein